jgi:hypothetical protein
MTSIANAAITADTGLAACVPKPTGQPHDTSDLASFAAMLARNVDPEQVSRRDLTPEELNDLLAPDAAAEQGDALLPIQTAAVAPQPTTMMQSAVQAAYLAFVAAGGTDAAAGQAARVVSRAGGANDPAEGGQSGVSVAQSIVTSWLGGAQRLLPRSDLDEAHEKMDTGTIVLDRRAVASGSLSAPLVRQETHLLAATSSATTIGQFVLGNANADGEPNSPGSDIGPLTESVRGLPKSRPGADEGEGLTVQIAGQVAGVLPSLRGALPVDAASGGAPVVTVGPVSEPASDVVKTIRFDLKPGELGEVHVRLSMSRNEVRLHLSFSSDKAASIAQAEGQALEKALADAGASVGQIVIDAVSLPRADALPRSGGLSMQAEHSSGSSAGGNGADREHRSHQETARGHSLRHHSSEESVVPGDIRTGLFI